MPQWRDHLNNFDVLLIGYTLFGLSLLGLVVAFVKKDRLIIPFAPFFIIPFILLSNRVFPFNLIFDYLLRFSILQEVLRFVFTKVSILMIFGQIIFFSYFLVHALKHLSAKLVATVLTISLLVYAFPVFQGGLFSPQVKISIPPPYFDLWQFMSSQPQGRTLALPLHDPAGWTYTSWGYQGSGLSWFGLSQSITDRDSDRWSPINEESYRELYTAI
jgi:hypothetical protein